MAQRCAHRDSRHQTQGNMLNLRQNQLTASAIRGQRDDLTISLMPELAELSALAPRRAAERMSVLSQAKG